MTELEYSEFLKGETDLEREAELISLEHYGIKNQKWGVRRGPPYPIVRGGKSASVKKKKKPGFISKLKTRKKKPAEKSETSAKTKEQKKKESDEQIRKKLLTSTDAKYIYEHRDLLSYQELKDRIDRINKEQDLKKLIPGKKKEKSTLKRVEEYVQSLSNIANSMQKAYTAYSVISKGLARDAEARKKKEESDRKVQLDAAKKMADERAKAREAKKTEREAKLEARNERIAAQKEAANRRQREERYAEELQNIRRTLTAMNLASDRVEAITKSYDTMANADKEAISKYQKNLLRRAEEERQKRKKSWH